MLPNPHPSKYTLVIVEVGLSDFGELEISSILDTKHPNVGRIENYV